MAVSSSRSGKMAGLHQASKKWKEQMDTSPERTKVWIEPPNSKHKSERKVPVLYYLSRNGKLEQPHFMEISISSPDGLYLKDVINRLNILRGVGMAAMYSWSCKRSYKNGFVWHDLSDKDLIYPAQGQEYVLKGSELLETKFSETISSKSKKPPSEELESRRTAVDVDAPAVYRRRRNQSSSSIDFDLHEYNVYKADSSGSTSADASTQTDDRRRRRRSVREAEAKENHEIVEENCKEPDGQSPHQNQASLEKEEIEISPPPSDSSPETLETLMKSEGRMILRPETIKEDPTEDTHKPRPSSVLMQLISCGSVSFKDCGTSQGLNLIPQYKKRLPRGKESGELAEGTGRLKLEGKEYFSGSLIQTKNEEFPALKRSSSYNADRISQFEVADNETEGVATKYTPRKSKTRQFSRKEESSDLSCNTTTICS